MTVLSDLSGDPILYHVFGLVLVLTRIGGMFVLLPGFGESSIPTVAKVGMVFGLAILLLPVVEWSLPPRPESEVILGCMVLAELADGLWFGWLIRIMVTSLPYAGQIIADCAGLANVLLPSPELGSQTTAVARLYEVAVPTLILTSGLYKTLLSSLVGYYRLVPAGSLVLLFDNAATCVMMVAECFDLALRLAAPFILASVAWNVVLGLIVRLVPRLQVFFVALPGQIALGSILLAGVAAPMIRAWMEAMRGAISLLPGAG